LPIQKKWSELTSWNIRQVPKRGGVYELGNRVKREIYIGRASNLRTRLEDHLNSEDDCIQKASYFRYEVTRSSKRREKELFDRFERKYRRLPDCNKQRP
jgi:hypothetical protein